jgi:hypothetical protein
MGPKNRFIGHYQPSVGVQHPHNEVRYQLLRREDGEVILSRDETPVKEPVHSPGERQAVSNGIRSVVTVSDGPDMSRLGPSHSSARQRVRSKVLTGRSSLATHFKSPPSVFKKNALRVQAGWEHRGELIRT